MNLQDKTFLVTGAGSGIGQAVSLRLLSEGCKVVGVDLSEEGLQKTKERAGEKSENFKTTILNISDQEKVEALAKGVTIDGLINNAGIIQPFVKVSDIEYDAIQRVFNVNFMGTLYMIKSFLPSLLERPEGYIANVSSMGGFLPVPGQSVYGASKAAVKLLSEGLYAELAGTNVHVSTIFPGATKTNIAENSGVTVAGMSKEEQDTASASALPAEEAAEIIVSGIKKNKPLILVGKDSKFMNRLYRLAPVFATNFIAKKMKALLG